MDQIDETTHPEGQATDAATAVDTAPAAETTGSVETATASVEGGGAQGRTELTPTFLTELAHAMQAAADRERERIASVVADDAAQHVEKVRGRAAVETEELRRLAEEDVQRIEEWSAAEIERVRAEAARRVEDRRSSLEDYLKQHDAIIDTEIEGVQAAVREYEGTLDRFFGDMANSDDPSDIARRAGTLPPPPNLDEVRAAARAAAVAKFADLAPPAPGIDLPGGDAAGEGGTGAEAGDTTVAGAEAMAPETEAAAESTTAPEGAEAGSSEASAPVGVMDPTVTASPTTWPPDDRFIVDEGTAAVGVAANGTANGSEGASAEARSSEAPEQPSAAVRLLRSIAPWTAPNSTEERQGPTTTG